MNFEASRTFAEKKLDSFIDNNLNEYSKLRNFDFGPNKRSNISCISPYVTHGVINEIEIIKKSLKKYSFVKNEKFIQEVLWRVYWKGWLELRPDVWTDFKYSLKKLKKEYENNNKYIEAINAKTNIDVFNSWVNELKNFNYLHNHTRMWFASIWIFSLKLPWQLGAEFFLQHLYDGDAASNTLGWRWVAGVQTKGKHYIATEWNIKKFTNNRFNNIKLNENAPPVNEDKFYKIISKNFNNLLPTDDRALIVFDNNLSFETSDFVNQKFDKILLVSNDNKNRQIILSEKLIEFKNALIKDQKKRLNERSINCEIITIEDLLKIKDKIYALYPEVGENLDYLNLNKLENISFLYRKIDQYSWKFCNKGFFNFKNYIPKIIQEFT
tara:strand:- start:136 stop:1281 length:1146 start_codon:yes stop_codon:yes gene_type:complete